MFQQIMQYLGYARTGVWLWTLVSTSAIGVAIWAYLARLPLVIVAVLALGTGVLVLIGVETAKRLRGRRYRRAVVQQLYVPPSRWRTDAARFARTKLQRLCGHAWDPARRCRRLLRKRALRRIRQAEP